MSTGRINAPPFFRLRLLPPWHRWLAYLSGTDAEISGTIKQTGRMSLWFPVMGLGQETVLLSG
jgi:hypothetical protein